MMKANTINQLLTSYNRSVASSTKRIKYIVIHYVGAVGGAKANVDYYASQYVGASAHYYVGFEGEVWQSVEDKDIAWHCGAKTYKHPDCRNSNSLGIEMCVRNKGDKSDTSKDWYFEDATVMATIDLTRTLMAKYDVPADHVIRHYDVTGKICPNPYVYNHTKHTWEAFKKAISSSQPSTSPEVSIVQPGFFRASDGKRWQYRYQDGSYANSGWCWLIEATFGTSAWYYFDRSGYMLTGHQTASDGREFYLCEKQGADEGKCMVTDDQGVLQILAYDPERKRYKI
ncbi:MAG: peptidoglycan recognition family protein [Clostridium sp.]